MKKIKNNLRTIIIIFGSIALIFLLLGSWIFYSYTYPDNIIGCLGMSVLNSFEALLLNPLLTIEDIYQSEGFVECLSGFEKFFMITYSIAVIAAPVIDFLIIFSVLDSLFHWIVGKSGKKENILIVGFNDDVRKVIERKKTVGKVFLWTEKYISSEDEKELYYRNVSVERSDFSLGDSPEKYEEQIDDFNKFIKRKKITYVLLLEESDVKNNQYYMALSSCDVCEKKTIHFFVHNRSFEERNMIQDYFDSQLNDVKDLGRDNTYMDMNVFNYDQIQAVELFENRPIYEGVDLNGAKDVHILIAGGNSLSLYVALEAINQAVLSSDNKILIDIIDDDISGISKELENRFDGSILEKCDSGSKCNEEYVIKSDVIDGLLQIRLSQHRMMDNDLSTIIPGLKDDSSEYNYVVLCSKHVDENIHVLRSIENNNIISIEGGIPFAIRMTYTRETKEYLLDYNCCSKVYLMGENEEYIGIDHIINLEEEDKIKKYNQTYDSVSTKKIFSAEVNKDAELLWNSLEYYKRLSNRSLFHHKKVKEEVFSNCDEEMKRYWELVNNKNADKREAELSKALMDGEYPRLQEMAKTEHRRWAYFFAGEGWKYGKKNAKLKQHDCLCNWEKLKETKPDLLVYDLISSPLLMGEEQNSNQNHV